jgi:hypothetical protein
MVAYPTSEVYTFLLASVELLRQGSSTLRRIRKVIINTVVQGILIDDIVLVLLGGKSGVNELICSLAYSSHDLDSLTLTLQIR